MGTYQVDSRSRWGPVWKTSVLFKRTVFVTGSVLLSEAFREESRKKTKAFFPPHQKQLFGANSLIVQSGPYHLKLRRTILQSLSPKAIAGYEGSIRAEVDEFVAACKARKGTFALVPELRSLLIKVVVRILFGQNAPENTVTELREELTLWIQGLVAPPLAFLPWTTAARALRARRRIVTILHSWITRCRNGAAGQGSLLEQLVNARDPESGEQLSDDAIVDNVLTLIVAGSDTTASGIASAFRQLSLTPKLQQELRELSSEEQPAAFTAFMNEVLRANPPAAFAMRLVDGEPLKVGGFDVPTGWLVCYGFAGTLGGDAEAYPRPGEFDERRFREAATKQWAFGGGPRLCPGMGLAMTEARIMLQTVLGPSGIRWRLEEGQDLTQRYTPGYFPADGLRVELLEK